MHDSEHDSDIPTQRLCSEIQLFDLCDLASCRRKNGRFCTDPDMLSRFEKIAEDELRAPKRYISEEIGDDEADGDGDGDGYEDDEFLMENDDSWDEEE